jgi:hypothetical protein
MKKTTEQCYRELLAEVMERCDCAVYGFRDAGTFAAALKKRVNGQLKKIDAEIE